MTAYPCPCCGTFSFRRPPGSYDVCAICEWEDDALQLEFATTLDGGANSPTLEAAQREYLARGAVESIRPRDPTWRPIDPRRDTFEAWDDPTHRRVPAVDERLYYWRAEFWRNSAT